MIIELCVRRLTVATSSSSEQEWLANNISINIAGVNIGCFDVK